MGRIRKETWRSLSHITGPGAVWMGLLFGVTPEAGPRIIRAMREGNADGAVKFDLERYVTEVMLGVAEANSRFDGSLSVEAIQIVVDDYPTPGQVKYVAFLLARHALTGEDFG